MRSDLKAIEGITNIVTDLDEKTCSFQINASMNVEELINGLSETNNKISEWTFVE